MMHPLRWLRYASLALFSVLWTAGCITLALGARLVTGGHRVPLAMARRLWAPFLLAVAGVRLEVQGLENVEFSRAHLFAVNHRSQVDIPVLFRALPVELRFVVKEELRRVPFLGWYIQAMGMVFIHRKLGRRSLAMMRQLEELIASGGSVAAFPEGTRSRDRRIRPFKSGVLLPALEAGVPVVPVAMHGAAEILPPGGFRPRPGTVRVALGEPIEVPAPEPGSVPSSACRRAFAEEVRQRVVALYEGLERAGRSGPWAGSERA